LNALRCVVIVAEAFILGIDHPCKDAFGAVLDADQTAFALIDIVEETDLFVEGIGFIPVESIHTIALDAVVAVRTILPPVHDPQFTHDPLAGRGRIRGDMVFCGHG
jgi:hypothetical protein